MLSTGGILCLLLIGVTFAVPIEERDVSLPSMEILDDHPIRERRYIGGGWGGHGGFGGGFGGFHGHHGFHGYHGWGR